MSIKIAIIGAGGMGTYHVTGFRQAGAEIVALADVNSAAAEKAAAQHGIPRTFTSAPEMLRALPEIDAVSIIVPNKFHAPLAIGALRAGKHVFCEKPPALNAREMMQMKTAAEKAKRRLMFNFNNRARPESYAMMEHIQSGVVGRINTCQAKWIRRTGIPGFGGWFTNKALSGGGPLIDLLHMIDLSLHFMGYPEPAHLLARTFDDHIQDRTFNNDRVGGLPTGPDLEQRKELQKQMREAYKATRRAVIRVVQDQGGKLLQVELVQPSNDQKVDKEALADVRAAAEKLPPPPPEALEGRATLSSIWSFELVISISPPVPTFTFEFDEALGFIDMRLPLDRRIYKKVRLVSVE